MKLYREFATQEEIDAHYNVLGNVADPDAIIAAWAAAQRSRGGAAECRLDVRYGPTLRRVLRRVPGRCRRAGPRLHPWRLLAPLLGPRP